MKLSIVLALVTASTFAVPVRAQQALRTVTGATGAHFGGAVLTVPDQNTDGVEDVLVGAPYENGNHGAVHCISGAYLATGAGSSVLWSCTASSWINSGSLFGWSLASVGDVTGDGIADFAVGAPNDDYLTYTNGGSVLLISGATRSVYSVLHKTFADHNFGRSLATVGDITSDGKAELVVGAPGVYQQVSGAAIVISGAALGTFGHSTVVGIGGGSGGAGYGTSVASGFDLDADGINDIAIGSPFDVTPNAPDSGVVMVIKATVWNTPIAHYQSPFLGERLGTSLDAAHDYDGDGVIDIVAGAPNKSYGVNTQDGRVLVLSGAKMRTNTLPKEMVELTAGAGTMAANWHFGATVRALGDLTGDGVGEILVGTPDYGVVIPFGPNRGAVSIFSGSTFVKIGGHVGANNDRLGDALGSTIQDLNGDGFREFVIGGSTSDSPGTDAGHIKCMSLYPCYPSTYCTGKVNSIGCTPSISWSGLPSATSASPFLITCSNKLNQKTGLLIYSLRPQAVPFYGGTLCVRPPIKRTSSQNSGGTLTGQDCTGTFSFDFNARIQSGVDATLVPGAEVFAQYWSRDPWPTPTYSLSNGLRCVVQP